MTAGPPLRVLVVLPHPDDPEYFCGGAVARWTSEGVNVHYCLLTRGDKGSDDPDTDPAVLAKTREEEQRRAASVLGVHEVDFLSYQDGTLEPDLDLRRDIVRVIRRERPNRVVTSAPDSLTDGYLNHSDHRACGQATLDALYPAAGSGMYFPELLRDEGLAPHKVSELYVALPADSNLTIDVTDYLDKKVAALLEHRSQIREPEKLADRIREWMRDASSPPDSPRYVERFTRVDLS
ncbi:MAG: PIG-L deacetylase family protein [Anaerolineales bacterium]